MKNIYYLLFIIFFWLIKASFANAATLDVYMADPEVRIAQKIYCQIGGVVPTDKIRATLDGSIIYQKDGNLQSEEE